MFTFNLFLYCHRRISECDKYAEYLLTYKWPWFVRLIGLATPYAKNMTVTPVKFPTKDRKNVINIMFHWWCNPKRSARHIWLFVSCYDRLSNQWTLERRRNLICGTVKGRSVNETLSNFLAIIISTHSPTTWHRPIPYCEHKLLSSAIRIHPLATAFYIIGEAGRRRPI